MVTAVMAAVSGTTIASVLAWAACLLRRPAAPQEPGR